MEKPSKPAKMAQRFVKGLYEVQELVQASIASSQHEMVKYSNQDRQEAKVFIPGDCVWPNFKNLQTP